MKKILIVDDEMSLRELMGQAFEKEGFDVETAPNALQALDMLTRETFDAVVVDHKLPGESGLDLLKKLRQRNTEIPAIVYSGALTTELEKEAREAGANEVMAKSLGIPALILQIKTFMEASRRLATRHRESPILVVDDDAGVRNVLISFFQQKGYTLLSAENGEKALEILSTHNVSVVLLDIDMPVMDGLKTLARIREIKPELGVVMATAEQDSLRIQTALKLGAYSYVLKPFDFLYLELVVLSKLILAGKE
jgi:two-component system, sensor histidine kinase and response regulator